MRRKFLSLFIPFGWLTFSVCALAQLTPTDTNLDTGIKPYETFDRAQENVNIGSGNLNIQIPVLHLPGRNGHDFDLTLTYNSQNWTPVASVSQFDNYGKPEPTPVDIGWTYGQAGANGIGSTGWQFSLPMLYATGVTIPPPCVSTAQGCLGIPEYYQSSSYTDFYLVMGDGRKYSFPHASFYNWQSSTSPNQTPEYGCLPVTGSDILIDYDYPANGSPTGYQPGGGGGEGVMLDLTNAANGTGTAVVRFRDGSQMLFPITLGNTTCPNGSTGPATATASIETGPSGIVDSNGNVIFGGTCTVPGTSPPASGTEDSVGRCLSLGAGFVRYNDSSGAPQSINLTVPEWSIQNPTYPYFCLPATNVSNLPGYQSACANAGSDTGIAYVGAPQAITSMVSTVTLPDNLAYTFAYNEWGEITEITYPTGGYTRYIYQPNEANSYIWTTENGSPDLTGMADNRMVVEKDTCAYTSPGTQAPSGYVPGGTPGSRCSGLESKTTYVHTPSGLVQVVDPQGNETDYTFAGSLPAYWPENPPIFINYSNGGAGGPEATRIVYQGSGSSKILLRTVSSQYNGPGYKTSETTTVPNVGTSQTVWNYDTTHNVVPFPTYADEGASETGVTIIVETDNMLDKYECGFGVTGNCGQGNSALVRWTHNLYLGTNSVNNINYQAPPIYNVNRLFQQTIYNGSGGQVAQTTYQYDSYPSISASDAIQHGTSLNSYSTSYTTRANVTQATYWTMNGGTSPITSYYYDDAGNVVKKTDSLNYTTTYNYSDNWANSTCQPSGGIAAAYPKSITNAASQTTTYTWNSCSGTMASVKDPNNNTISFAYDVMDRRIQALYPSVPAGQPETCLQYSDAPNTICPSILASQLPSSLSASQLPIEIAETKLASPNPSEINAIFLDGLSRVLLTQLQSDPDGIDNVVTTYDLAGNIASVTNPFRTTNDPTYGVTQYGYDALHRKVIQIQQDGTSALQWCYDDIFTNVSSLQHSGLCTQHLGGQTGDWVDSMDENSNHWQRTSDALGRLLEVMEPGGAVESIGTSVTPSLETDYTYNTLDDLTNVNQRGNGSTDTARTRSFTYDGLSRLMCASNPENSSASCPATYSMYVAGTTGYSYDADSNLVSKTDARGIAVNYKYDNLNRLYQKNYTIGSSNTTDPTVCMQYDTPGANAAGRPTLEWTQPAGTSCPGQNNPVTTPPSNAITSRVLGYDAMGELAGDEQCPLGGTCSSGYPFSYGYDLAGDLNLANNGIPTSSTTLSPISWQLFSDGALRLDHMTVTAQPSSWSTSTYLGLPTLLQATANTGYDPLGHLVNASLGITSTNSSGAMGIARASDNRGRLKSENDTGAGIPGTATANITGTEQLSAYSSGSITFSGTEQCSGGTCDGGQFLVTIGTSQPILVTYNQNSTPSTLASNLASLIGTSCTSNSYEAAANGAIVSLQSCAARTNNNYSISASPDGHSSSFSSYSFSVTASGSTMTPIIYATTLGTRGIAATFSNTGSGQVTTGLFQFFVYLAGTGPPGVYSGTLSWSSADTTSTLASRLATAIGSCASSGAAVGALADGPSIYLVNCQGGTSYVLQGSLDYSNGSAGFLVNLTSTPASSVVPSITFSGTEQGGQTGVLLATIATVGSRGGPQQVGASWSSSSTPSTLASALASGLGSCSTNGNGMVGVASGATVYLGPCNASATYTISENVVACSCSSSNPADFSAVVTTEPPSGQLPPVPGATYDSGTVKLTVSGTQIASAPYNSESTPETIAGALAANSSRNVATVAASGSNLTITSISGGQQSDYSYSISETSSLPATFTGPSFVGSPSSGSLAGGGYAPLYNWAVTSFAPNGNILAAQDNSVTGPVMGSWSYNYDNLNRVANSGSNESHNSYPNYCWNYDSFGNRTMQMSASGAISSTTGGATTCSYSGNLGSNQWASYNSLNHMSQNNQNVNQGNDYDAAGDIYYDGANNYLYDGEGRLCAVQTGGNGGSATGYLYNAEGTRVVKGSMSSFTACPNSVSSFVTVIAQYLLDPGGDQVTELNGSGGSVSWAHTNIWASGTLDATYDTKGLHFQLSDWLGTRRMQTSYAGGWEEEFQSLPFGDGLNKYQSTLATADDATEHHFTGKERDTESGNDYFDARYYSSAVGRFMSPDPIVINDLRTFNPQRWNKYSYAINSPLVFDDPSGMDAAVVTFTTQIPVVGHDGLLSVHPDGNVTFAQFYPKGGAVPYGAGEVGTLNSANGDLPKLEFGSNGYPTESSLSALKGKLSQLRNVNPNSISIAYFKTSSSETAALDEYIANSVAASKTGNLKYFFFGASCVTFCQNGMKAAGLDDFHNQLPIPNLLGFNWWWAAGQGIHDNPKKEIVTHKICDEHGKHCH